MKRKIFVFVAIFISLFLTEGFSEDEEYVIDFREEVPIVCPPQEEVPCICAKSPQPLLEFKAGYFIFSSEKLRKVYDQGGVDIQLSTSYPVWRWLQIYGSIEYLQRHGSSLNARQKTSIWEVPLSLGLKPVIEICQSMSYYLALGPRYFFVHAHNRSTFVDKNISQNGFGGFVNTGLHFFPVAHLLIDVFAEYSYGRLHFHPSKTNVYGRAVQVGGFAFGAGLGYAF